MPDNCVETACSSCCHLPVCRFKEEFLNAQASINKMTISKSDLSLIKLSDIPYINSIILQCKYYSANNIVFRNL